MFVRSRKAKGSTYYAVVESYREAGKIKHRQVAALGRHQRLEDAIAAAEREVRQGRRRLARIAAADAHSERAREDHAEVGTTKRAAAAAGGRPGPYVEEPVGYGACGASGCVVSGRGYSGGGSGRGSRPTGLPGRLLGRLHQTQLGSSGLGAVAGGAGQVGRDVRV